MLNALHPTLLIGNTCFSNIAEKNNRLKKIWQEGYRLLYMYVPPLPWHIQYVASVEELHKQRHTHTCNKQICNVQGDSCTLAHNGHIVYCFKCFGLMFMWGYDWVYGLREKAAAASQTCLLPTVITSGFQCFVVGFFSSGAIFL